MKKRERKKEKGENCIKKWGKLSGEDPDICPTLIRNLKKIFTGIKYSTKNIYKNICLNIHI